MDRQDRLFSETEVGDIVKRAAELQESRAAQSYTPGVTLEELRRIANEMGVSPEYIQAALAEREKPRESDSTPKRKFVTKIERVVDGELDPNDFDVIAAELPVAASPQMQPAQIGRTLKAAVMYGGATANVNVTARNGRTRVQVESKPILTTVFGGQSALMGTIFGSVLMGTHQNPIAGAAIMAAGFLGGIGLFLLGMKSSSNAAGQLADRLVDAVEGRIAETHEAASKNLSDANPESVSETIESRLQT